MRWLVLSVLPLAALLPGQSPFRKWQAEPAAASPAAQLAALQGFAHGPHAVAAIPEVLEQLRTRAPAWDNDGCLLLEAILRHHQDADLPVPAVRDALLEVIARPRWTSRQKGAQALAELLRRPAAREGAQEQLARALVPLLASQRSRVNAAATRCLALLPGAPTDGDPVAARAWCHARFGGAVDLHSARFEDLLVLREAGQGWAFADGTALERDGLRALLEARRAAALERRRTFAVVLQAPAAVVEAAVAAPGLGRYGSILSELAAVAGGEVTLAPDSDVFSPPFAEPPARHAELRAALADKLTALCRSRVPGVQAAVVLADGTLLEFTCGHAERGAKTPLPSDGRMLAGSVGKTFFAALALQLAGEGRLGLDDKVAKWLGGEAWWSRLPNGDAMTLRHLLQHRSGLPRYEFAPQFVTQLLAKPDHRFTPREELEFVFAAQPRFAPGEGFSYADTNYVLLGLVLERVLGQSCYEAIEQRFLVPMALGATVPSVGRRIAGLLQGHAGEGHAFGGRDAMLEDGLLPFDVGFEGAGGGFASTAGDLARWGQALYCGSLLGAQRAELLDGPEAPLGPGVRYACGAILQNTRLGAAAGHSGFFPGWLTELRTFPAHGLAVAIMVNSSAEPKLARELGQWAVDLAELARGG